MTTDWQLDAATVMEKEIKAYQQSDAGILYLLVSKNEDLRIVSPTT